MLLHLVRFSVALGRDLLVDSFASDVASNGSDEQPYKTLQQSRAYIKVETRFLRKKAI